MAFNKFMHPRNPYKVPPDFKQVAIEYPEFRKHVFQDLSGKLKYNFKDPNALKVFTTSLLHKDFGLSIDIPVSRLVPTLPLRLNYILWIEDLLELNQIQLPVHGIDLGTGASCIYPLLGHKKNSWHMLALETDTLSCECALKNVEQNGVKDFITVKNTSLSPHSLEPWLEPDVKYSFTMCNPPFYASSEVLRQGSKGSTPRQKLAGVVIEKTPRTPPSNGHTGSGTELSIPGGEVAFVKSFVEANLHLQQIKIFTTMLGHKTSFITIKQYLSQHPSVKNISTTEFCQGNTMRWGIAWTTAENIKLKDELPRKASVNHKSKPLVCVLLEEGVESVMSRVFTLCDTLKIIYKVLKKTTTSCKLNMTAYENTWSKQRRLKRQGLKREKTNSSDTELNEADCEVNEENIRERKSKENSSINITVRENPSDSKFTVETIKESTPTETNVRIENPLKHTGCEISADLSLNSQPGFETKCCEPARKKARIEVSTCHENNRVNSEVTDRSQCNGTDPEQETSEFNRDIHTVRENILNPDLEENCKLCDGSLFGETKHTCNSSSGKQVDVKTPLVVCNVLIEKLDSDSGDGVIIEMIWVSGSGSRDLPHQILQYLKNNL